MVARVPVLLGSVTRRRKQADGTIIPQVIDVITNMVADTATALGAPALDPTLLQGTTRTGTDRPFRFPLQGTRQSATITVVTDGLTPGNNPKEYQFQVPKFFPLYLLDDFLSGLVPVGFSIVGFRLETGRTIAMGSTQVT